MPQKEFANETMLMTDRLAEERRMREVLADWGMDPPAVARMLLEHRERQASALKAREAAAEGVIPAALIGVDPARPATHLR